MPDVKNAAGYFAADGMDLLDLFIGSEGTLGVMTEVELRLLPEPPVRWGIMDFFPAEAAGVQFVRRLREAEKDVSGAAGAAALVAVEFFDRHALDLLRRQKASNPAFADLPEPAEGADTAIYVEYHGTNDEAVTESVGRMAEIAGAAGGSEEQTWIADAEREMARLKAFRHAVPECVNLLIDERRKTHPALTKLGTDMAVPDRHLEEVMALYHDTLDGAALDYVMFGHIGNNHLHVNILPRTPGGLREGPGALPRLRAPGHPDGRHGLRGARDRQAQDRPPAGDVRRGGHRGDAGGQARFRSGGEAEPGESVRARRGTPRRPDRRLNRRRTQGRRGMAGPRGMSIGGAAPRLRRARDVMIPGARARHSAGPSLTPPEPRPRRVFRRPWSAPGTRPGRRNRIGRRCDVRTDLILAACVVFAGAGAAGVLGQDAQGNLRYTITVSKFDNEAGWQGQWDIGDRVGRGHDRGPPGLGQVHRAGRERHAGGGPAEQDLARERPRRGRRQGAEDRAPDPGAAPGQRRDHPRSGQHQRRRGRTHLQGHANRRGRRHRGDQHHGLSGGFRRPAR